MGNEFISKTGLVFSILSRFLDWAEVRVRGILATILQQGSRGEIMPTALKELKLLMAHVYAERVAPFSYREQLMINALLELEARVDEIQRVYGERLDMHSRSIQLIKEPLS